MGEPSPRTPQSEDRLDSWKEIAAYLKRDVRTVQRWEKREEMPVHRHLHDKIGSVYASRADLDAWMRSRNLRIGQENEDKAASTGPPGLAPRPAPLLRSWGVVLPLAVAGAVTIGATLWLQRTERFWPRRRAIVKRAVAPFAGDARHLPAAPQLHEEVENLIQELKSSEAMLLSISVRGNLSITRLSRHRLTGVSATA